MNPDPSDDRPGLTALASVRRLMRPRSTRQAERCALCDAELAPDHSHLVETATRRLACACEACAILFTDRTAAKYRRVPRRARYLPDFRLSDAMWEGLQLPIDLAFFLESSTLGRVGALYPSPAGATEALVPINAWHGLVAENPVLAELEPDVEALLVNRVGEARDCYRVGVDVCYSLVGLIRKHWRGLSGGPAVWGEIARYFADLKTRSS